jgi:hypothetical protein
MKNVHWLSERAERKLAEARVSPKPKSGWQQMLELRDDLRKLPSHWHSDRAELKEKKEIAP